VLHRSHIAENLKNRPTAKGAGTRSLEFFQAGGHVVAKAVEVGSRFIRTLPIPPQRR
jgi:hypothetical protein